MSCVICSSEYLSVTNSYERCLNCGHYKFENYERNFYLKNKYKGRECFDYEIKGFGRELSELRLELLLQAGIKIESSKLLDIGCGVGTFIDTCKRYGISAMGIDINSEAVRIAKSLGRNVVLANVDGGPVGDLAHYNVVTLFDVIEHFNDLSFFIKNYLLIKTVKWVGISTPCVDDVKEKDILQWRHYRLGEHIHAFTKTSLIWLLTSIGFSIRMSGFQESVLRVYPEYPNNILTVIAEVK